MIRLLDPTTETAGNNPPTASVPPVVTPTPIPPTTVRPGTFAVIETAIGDIVVKVEDFAKATLPKIEATAVADFKYMEKNDRLTTGILIGVAASLALVATLYVFGALFHI